MAERRPRLVMVAETPSMPTGFGQQTRVLCEELVKRGWDVFLLAQAVPMKEVPMTGVTEWRYANIHDIDLLDSTIHSIAPDCVFIFGCTAAIAHYLQFRSFPGQCPAYYWLPYEGSKVPGDAEKSFRGIPKDSIVHLSDFAKELWSDLIDSDVMIPHVVDLDLWKYDPEFTDEERKMLRREWSKRLRFPLFEDSIIVLNIDRNIWHKRWDGTYDFVRRLQKLMPDREVQLIAHTKMIQTTEKGHPPGYSLPYLEKTFGLAGSVAYTGFDWGNNLEREHIVELMKLCDLRITTSEGEGFGIPTIEAAAVGTLQVVNNQTTMPELLGRDSMMLVDAAMTEDKMGSLWQVPNINGMAQRAHHLLTNPEVAAAEITAAREHVEKTFSVDAVVGAFDDLFRKGLKEKTRDQRWLDNRWGFIKQSDMQPTFEDLGRAVAKIEDHASVLEIGSFDGQFVDVCSKFGIEIQGIEEKPEAVARASERAKMFLRNQPYADPWPNADVVVMTDMLDHLFHNGGGQELVQEVFTRIATFRWAFLRFRPGFLWGNPTVDGRTIGNFLQSKGMTRRFDLEKLIKEKFTNIFEHQVWQRGKDTSHVPHALIEES